LPYGIFSTAVNPDPRVGVAIGTYILDLSVVMGDLLDDTPRYVFDQPTLNPLMAQGPAFWHEVRTAVQDVLGTENSLLRDYESIREAALIPQKDATMHLPVAIGDYTDFYSSKEHASNVGHMFRGPEHLLTPNWLHMPVAYHGRSSSVVLSGTDIRRPHGQVMEPGADSPRFTPSHTLDFELEMGFFIGGDSALGHPIPIADAHNYIFGMVLLNDWSARDIQFWEYRPLGPFTAKNFATTISPWVVPMAALEPFRCPSPTQSPAPLPYLLTEGKNGVDIALEVSLQGAEMASAATISRSNARHLYWTMEQQLAHHTVTGCNVRVGDLLGSGTISSPSPDGYGSMLELSWRGRKPMDVSNGDLKNGRFRTFLEDGDTITLTGCCQGDGYRIGFGEATGTILPALT
jgi:fumarylacetoacetase